MFTSILANVGIGVGIAIVLFVILAMTTRDTMHYVNYNGDEQFRGKLFNSCRMFNASQILAMTVLDIFLIINGSSILKTIGLTVLIYAPVGSILGFIISLNLEKVNSDEDECKDLALLAVSIINILICSVFSVLIINHFHLI